MEDPHEDLQVPLFGERELQYFYRDSSQVDNVISLQQISNIRGKINLLIENYADNPKVLFPFLQSVIHR